MEEKKKAVSSFVVNDLGFIGKEKDFPGADGSAVGRGQTKEEAYQNALETLSQEWDISKASSESGLRPRNRKKWLVLVRVWGCWRQEEGRFYPVYSA